MLAVALSIAASACWGVADFGAGLLSRRTSAVLILLVQQAAGAVIVGVVVLVTAEGPPGGEAIVLSLLAGAAGAFALGCFYRALAVGTMSVVAPISAAGVTLPVVYGVATGDRPSALQAAGLALTIVGVVLASREVAEPGGAVGASRQSVLLALLAAVGFGSFFIFSDGAADDSVLWLLLLGRSVAVVLLLVVAAANDTLRVPTARDGAAMALVGVLDLTATGLYAVASTEGLLAIVAVVGALYPVTTVLLARVVLHERLRAVQAAGVALAFTGVAAVAGGA